MSNASASAIVMVIVILLSLATIHLLCVAGGHPSGAQAERTPPPTLVLETRPPCSLLVSILIY